MNIFALIRRNIYIYRTSLILLIVSVSYFIRYSYTVVLWLLFLIIIGKIYEILFLGRDKRWDSDPVSLNLMVVSKFAEYVWNGFR
ncbi:hypothetical protein FB008_110146 [Sinorhizobium medicae]|nr:hypothetical protein FB008_110146 [Sinorhizobium medicae]